MLNQLHIQNFQSHEDSIIEFGPGVNTLVGTSNAGKSAILRSLYLTLKSRPSGGGYVRKGTDECLVQTTWNRNNTLFEVGRGRNNKTEKNYYTLTGYDDFTSPGQTVPQPVLEAINLSDINIQTQFAPYFLVFDSPGAIAKYIKSVTGLEKVDEIAAKISSRLKKNKGIVTEKEFTLKEVTEQLHIIALIPLDRLQEAITGSEFLISSRITSNLQIEHLEAYCIQLKELYSQEIFVPEERFNNIKQEIPAVIRRFQSSISKRDIILPAVELWTTLESQAMEISEEEFINIQKQIQVATNNYDNNTYAAKQLTAGIESWKLLEKDKLVISLDVTDFGVELISSYQNYCSELLRLHELTEEVQDIEHDLKDIYGQLEILRVEEKELQSQLVTCPECGSELNETSKQMLLSK